MVAGWGLSMTNGCVCPDSAVFLLVGVVVYMLWQGLDDLELDLASDGPVDSHSLCSRCVDERVVEVHTLRELSALRFSVQ